MKDKVVETLAFQYLPSQSKTVTTEVMKMLDVKRVEEGRRGSKRSKRSKSSKSSKSSSHVKQSTQDFTVSGLSQSKAVNTQLTTMVDEKKVEELEGFC